MYNGRGTKRAYQEWLRDMSMDIVESGEIPAVAASIAIQGAVWAGAKAFTVTSGPGFSLMMENLGLGVMMEAPCVIVNVMRGGPSTGLPTMPAQADVMQARWGTHGDHPAVALVRGGEAPAGVRPPA